MKTLLNFTAMACTAFLACSGTAHAQLIGGALNGAAAGSLGGSLGGISPGGFDGTAQGALDGRGSFDTGVPRRLRDRTMTTGREVGNRTHDVVDAAGSRTKAVVNQTGNRVGELKETTINKAQETEHSAFDTTKNGALRADSIIAAEATKSGVVANGTPSTTLTGSEQIPSSNSGLSPVGETNLPDISGNGAASSQAQSGQIPAAVTTSGSGSSSGQAAASGSVAAER